MTKKFSSKPQPIGCTVMVINSQNKILLGMRKNSYLSGYYGFPGGRVNQEEKLIDCAKRELKEETNLMATELDYLGVVKEWQGQQNFVHFAFLCSSWTGKLKVNEPDKCTGWEWWPLTNLPAKILPGHKEAIVLLEEKEINLRDI